MLENTQKHVSCVNLSKVNKLYWPAIPTVHSPLGERDQEHIAKAIALPSPLPSLPYSLNGLLIYDVPSEIFVSLLMFNRPKCCAHPSLSHMDTGFAMLFTSPGFKLRSSDLWYRENPLSLPFPLQFLYHSNMGAPCVEFSAHTRSRFLPCSVLRFFPFIGLPARVVQKRK